jgi:hypothetical protein
VNEEGAPIDGPKLSRQDLDAARSPGIPTVAREIIRELWGKERGPIVVPYEQPQPTTPKRR